MAKRYSKSFTEKKLTYLTKHLEKYSIMKKKKNIENINLAWRYNIPRKPRNLRSRDLLLRPKATHIPHPTLRSRSSVLKSFPVHPWVRLLFPF